MEEELIDEPTLEEVEEIINKSRNGKTPCTVGKNAEVIKYGGEELHKKIWRCG